MEYLITRYCYTANFNETLLVLAYNDTKMASKILITVLIIIIKFMYSRRIRTYNVYITPNDYNDTSLQ